MKFWDRLGRIHTKLVSEENQYPTNNAYIYTAYYKVLHLDPRDLKLPENTYKRLPTKLPFSRHPDEAAPPISHDEITGVSIISKDKAKDICEYLENNHNQFCDIPGFVAKPWYKLNPFNIYKAFKALNKEENPRRAVINYPDTWNLAFWQRPEYRWFYKRCAGINPSLFEKLYFLVARGVSVFNWKQEDPNLLLFFCLKHLKQQDNLGIEGQIIQLYLNKVTGDLYEDINDMLKYATKDLPSQYYSVHPWITG